MDFELDKNNIFFINDCKVNPMEHSFELHGFEKKTLPPKIIEVIVYLATHYPRLISRKELINEIWSGNVLVGEKALTNAIWNLRQHFKHIKQTDNVIETIRKTGYRLLVKPKFISSDKKTVKKISFKSLAIALRPWITFVMGGLTVALMSYDSFYRKINQFSKTNIMSVTTEPGREVFPSPSPDGRYLAFTWEQPGQTVDLYLKDLQQSNSKLKRLTNDSSIEGASVWGDNFQYLYFYSKNIQEKVCTIVKLELATSNKTHIANCPLTGSTQIALSPNGKILTYYGQESDHKIPGIYLLNITHDDAKPIRLSCLLECDHLESDMAYSQDGKNMAVTRRFAFEENIYLINLQDNTQVQLTQGEMDIIGMAWHPDNKRLVYAVKNADIRAGYVMDVKSKKIQPLNVNGFSYPAFSRKDDSLFYHTRIHQYHISSLTFNENKAATVFPVLLSGFNHRNPNYCSANKKIAYISNESGYHELWQSDVDGKNRKQLTELKSTVSHPSWSNSGLHIAFVALRDDKIGNQIHIFDVSNKKIKKIPSPYINHLRPVWDKEDSTIIATVYNDEQPNLYRFHLSGTEPDQLTHNGAVYGLMKNKNELLFTQPDNSLWIKNINLNTISENLLPSKKFGAKYFWTYANNRVYFSQKNNDGFHVNTYDIDRKETNLLSKLSWLPDNEYGSLTIASEVDKLIFTISDYPQADIKKLEHPLLIN